MPAPADRSTVLPMTTATPNHTKRPARWRAILALPSPPHVTSTGRPSTGFPALARLRWA